MIYSRTEVYIKKLYKAINIINPYQLSIKSIASRLNIEVIYWEFSSEIVHYKERCKVFLNNTLSIQQQWQDFGHELKHYFFDEGNRLFLTDHYVGLQESKADYFAYHFCVPTFMLRKLKGVTIYDVMELFNVEFDFAYTRLEMYKSKVLSGDIYIGTR